MENSFNKYSFHILYFSFILQTLPDSHESYVLDGSTQAEFCTSQN